MMGNYFNLIIFHRNFSFFEIDQVIQNLQSLKKRYPMLELNKLCTGQPVDKSLLYLVYGS